MNNLDRLIARLEYPFRVSNEDVLDDIKRYWDEATDVVGGYWNDTDEEIAEEIGVSKPTLTELLDDNRLGMAYANLGGNSGVATYDLGEDWILINFTTGARYLYTTKSTSIDNIEQMKRYAHEGKGLNSYIMRMVKTDYAGRNVNGNLVIKPGMETYVHTLNKRLQLLYAFRNTMTTQVSNEGIFDTLKRMFGGGKPETENAPAQPKTKEIVYVWDRAGAVEKSPPTQLSDGHSNSPIFQQNGVYNPNWIARLEKDIAQYDRLTKEIIKADKQVAKWVNKWDPILDEFCGDADREAEFVETLKKWQAEQPKSWYNTFLNNHEFIGWGKYHWEGVDEPGFGYYPLQPGSNVTIPPQDANNTKRIVQIIAKLGKQILFGLGEDLTYVGYDFTDAPFRGYMLSNNAVDDIVSKIHYNAHTSETPYAHYMVVERRLEIILKALVDYVEASSINGTGMEVFKQATLKRYQEQLTTAGRDGLDPTARKIMSVGLELFGPVQKPSVESHTGEELVQSNEDLLSAVKKFFTPSKDKGIYDTVNKGFLQDLAKEVKKYTNPNWIKTRGIRPVTTIEVDGANLIDSYDQVVADFITECKANRAKQHEACEAAFKNMDEVLDMIKGKKLTDGDNVRKAITILKATRQIKSPKVEVPKVQTSVGKVKSLTVDEIVEKANKLMDLFNTLDADTTYVDRWNKNYINSHAWMDWKYVGKANYSELYSQVKDPNFTELYRKTMEHVYDMTYIGAEFHKLRPYVMAVFQLIEKSVED